MELKSKKPLSFSICILAHNEERYIERTIKALINSKKNLEYSIKVYANGCTDKTHEKVLELGIFNQNIQSVEIKIPSKINAWNTAFNEQISDIVIFCDGDVVPESNAIIKLIEDFEVDERRIIVSTRLFPLLNVTSIECLFTGFMQLPLKHEFLSGGMYAVKREKLKEKLSKRNLTGIPQGITGEDYFLERLIEPSEFFMSKTKNFYEPPPIKDYLRYLARIRWQNEQMTLVLGDHRDKEVSKLDLIKRKILGQKNMSYLFLSIPAVAMRFIFKKICSKKINEIYKSLGPVELNGEQVLTKLTRSHSTK